MAKRVLLIFWFVFTVAYTYSQDIITRTDGVVIKATKLDIKPNLISFQLFQQPDTLVYQISPGDVQSIQMADGSVKHFTPATATNQEAIPFNYESDFGRNMLWFYPIDLPFTNLTFAYERIAKSGKIGFRVPLTFGIGGTSENNFYNNFRRNNRFGAGLEINIYPFGQGKFEYFFGPTFNFRSFYNFYYMRPTGELDRENTLMFAPAFKNGIYYHFSKAFMVSVDVGLGVRFFQKAEIQDNYYPESRTRGFIPGNILIGYRF